MKAASFDYLPARSIGHAVKLLGEHPDSRLLAGGQSLGPMLNLRLARPARLIDIRDCRELRRYMDSPDAVVYGAGVTHAEIEDGTVPDPSPGWLRRAARNIAYRAIRNRGTIGGSLAHADPAADWPVVLAALDAEVWLDGGAGPRAEPLASFLRGPFATSLASDEILTAVRVPRPSPAARFGYCKLAAKRGEFAQALAVVFEDREQGTRRAVVGAIERAPLVVESEAELPGSLADAQSLLHEQLPAGCAGRVHAAALARAVRSLGHGGTGSCGSEASGSPGSERATGSDSDPRPYFEGTGPTTIRLVVNGRPIEADAEPRIHLADLLRERLHLTGTHLGCEHGVCGACTVLIDGAPARSCIAFAAACDGADVRTIEGFADDALMNALRAAFTRRHALQCGYCTPGMLVSAWDIARRSPHAGESRIREELAGNLCRCTGYRGIVEAIGDVLAEPERPHPIPHSGRLPPAAARMERPTTAPSAERPVLSPDGLGPRAIQAVPMEAAPAPPGMRAASEGAGDQSEITWRTVVPTTPETLWATLRDVERMAAALPGTELIGSPEDRPVRLRLTVAIGPMRATFDGEADIRWDAPSRSGRIDGQAHDPVSRSSSDGRIRFQVTPAPAPASGAALVLAIRYRIRGPLAQFSRGPVVDTVIERLLARFAENLGAAATGEAIADAPPPGGLRLLLAGIEAAVRRWFER